MKIEEFELKIVCTNPKDDKKGFRLDVSLDKIYFEASDAKYVMNFVVDNAFDLLRNIPSNGLRKIASSLMELADKKEKNLRKSIERIPT